MLKQQRADYILKRLNQLYPAPPVPLNHENEFTLLIAVLLSAQCTDERVNIVTKKLFKSANTPEKMNKLSYEKIYEYIKSCGLAPQKAKNIKKTASILIDKFQGLVPSDLDNLITLPGVGRKTALVVQSQAFKIPSFPVDTHIHRCAQRWKLTDGKNVLKTEEDLKKVFPKNTWSKVHLQIIYYGREHCLARKCYGLTCPICKELFPNRKQPIETKKT